MTKENQEIDDDLNFTRDLALFYFGYRAFIKQEDDLVLSYGIRQVHRRIIFFIGRLPGLTVNELLEVLDISKQALNGPMNELKEKELVYVKSNENDKRIKQLYLTEQGAMLDKRMNENQIKKMRQYFDESGDKTGAFWSKVMELYADEIGEKYVNRL
ncbi:helix-turn-helix domain-containing protein [Lactococcus sp.]|uniref:MarR family winged helix-turn-helix transcriptional regulator n=1 Tax=Lactococcus sp. TaxID=44273 RepID=UPI002FC8046A